MAGTTYEVILKEIKERRFRPVYYLMGEEPYYIDQLANRFATEVLNESEQEFNQTIVYAQDTNLGNILSLAKRYPMMAERQVIIVKEAQNLKNEIDGLSFYLQKPQPSTLLVFCHKNGSLDKRKKVTGDIERAGGAVFESKKMKEDLLPYFISNYARQHNATIDDKATMMMVESIGADLNRLVSELDKLLINMPQGATNITPDMVEEYTGISKEYNVFELKSALIAKDIAKANKIAKYMEDNPKNFPLQAVLPLLFSYYANLMLSYYAPQRTPQGVAAYLDMKSTWGVSDYLQGMRNYSAVKVMNIISAFRRYDGMSKGVGATANVGRNLLRELVYFILH
ncbi:MAG: DNA polymerase III subunit delta [Bacteroidaceae bacterium]|nr:DNA polymerase III subunit delta [Bacteroidaceae bacterium]